MPKIKKTTQKNLLPVVKTTQKTKKPRASSIDYYNCLLTQAQQDWYDPTTGKKKKITACCKECKVQAPALNKSRTQELTKLITAYQQVGNSLKKLLKPING